MSIWRPRAPGRTPNKPPTTLLQAHPVADFCAATLAGFYTAVDTRVAEKQAPFLPEPGHHQKLRGFWRDSRAVHCLRPYPVARYDWSCSYSLFALYLRRDGCNFILKPPEPFSDVTWHRPSFWVLCEKRQCEVGFVKAGPLDPIV